MKPIWRGPNRSPARMYAHGMFLVSCVLLLIVGTSTLVAAVDGPITVDQMVAVIMVAVLAGLSRVVLWLVVEKDW